MRRYVLVRLGYHEPTQVRGHVGHSVGPPPGPDGKDLGGHDPREAAHAHVEGQCEKDKDWQGK